MFKHRIACLLFTLTLMFAGNAYAATTVSLSIKNDVDNNGNISVVNGSKVKVRFKVIEDAPKSLSKKDKIQHSASQR